MVKFLILGAGYGTRLEKGIREDSSGKYTHLIGVPKPLIPLAGKPLISYWLEQMLASGKFAGPQDFYIVCNEYNYEKFVTWANANSVPVANIWNDGSTSNATRLGAVVDIQQMIEKRPALAHDDLIVAGGDTLFYSDFSLGSVIDIFNSRKDNMMLWYHDEEVEKTGILEVDDRGIVTAFLEKPTKAQTDSRKACPCFYVYRRETLPMLETYLAQTTTMKEKDAPGNFPAWLHKHAPIFAQQISGRIDIGGLQSYVDADAFYCKSRDRQKWNKRLVVAGIAGVACALFWRKYSSSSPSS